MFLGALAKVVGSKKIKNKKNHSFVTLFSFVILSCTFKAKVKLKTLYFNLSEELEAVLQLLPKYSFTSVFAP